MERLKKLLEESAKEGAWEEDEDVIKELSDELVQVVEGNSEFNELYLKVLALGFQVDDYAGTDKQVRRWARLRSHEVREEVKEKLRKLNYRKGRR